MLALLIVIKTSHDDSGLQFPSVHRRKCSHGEVNKSYNVAQHCCAPSTGLPYGGLAQDPHPVLKSPAGYLLSEDRACNTHV